MKKIVLNPLNVINVFLFLGIIFLNSIFSHATMYNGVEFPDGENSFADEVAEYTPGSYVSDPYKDSSRSLGVPDSKYTSLGNYGTLILKFTNNALTTSGDGELDLYIFESGNGTEKIDVSISSNGVDWIEVGRVTDGLTGIDIDAYTNNGVVLGALYSYVLLKDVGNDFYTGAYAGADINAVGAISSSPPDDDDDDDVDNDDDDGGGCFIKNIQSFNIISLLLELMNW